MRDIGDVDGEQPAIAFFLEPDRIVVVFRIGGVDGDHELVAPIFAACDFVGIGFFRYAACGGEHIIGKRGAQAEAVDDRVHVDARVAGPAENLDDAAARRVVGVIPVFHIDDDQLAGLRGGVARDVDCAVDCLVLAFDPAELAVLAIGADEAARSAGEDFFDAAADFIGLGREELAASAREALGAGFGDGNHHAVAIEGGAAIAAWDMDARVRSEVDPGGEV